MHFIDYLCAPYLYPQKHILKNFSKLGLSELTLNALKQLDIHTPTEIQEKAIPLLLEENCNFLGLAQTGTGKTAAYGLPLIEKIDTNKREIQALIITPTRELGQQVAEQLVKFSSFHKSMRVEVVYGGKPIDKQIFFLRKKPPILVATPGRLLDLINRNALNLKHIQYVVLDEADEMLNMGFQEDINTILSLTPQYKKIWLFSATMPPEIQDIAENYMSDYKEVRVKSEEKVNAAITHEFIRVKTSQKFDALLRVIEQDKEMRAVIFCRTRRDTQELADKLFDEGYQADAIHGDLNQNQRDRVMNRFKTKKLQFLIATDVAARGIDVKDLSHVIHYALPEQMEYYTHRSGRTARAGNEGTSIALLSAAEYSRMKMFSRELQIVFEESPLQSEFEFDMHKGKDEKRGRGRGDRDRDRGNDRGGRKKSNRFSERTYSRNNNKDRNEFRSERSSQSDNSQNNFRRKDKKKKSENSFKGQERNRERKNEKESKKPEQFEFQSNPNKRKRKNSEKPSFAGSSYDKQPSKRQEEKPKAGSTDKYRRKVFF